MKLSALNPPFDLQTVRCRTADLFLRPTAVTAMRLFEMPVATKDRTGLNENLLTPIQTCQSVFAKKRLYCAAIKAFLFFHLTFDQLSM
jgi:hypothetical protein